MLGLPIWLFGDCITGWPVECAPFIDDEFGENSEFRCRGTGNAKNSPKSRRKEGEWREEFAWWVMIPPSLTHIPRRCRLRHLQVRSS